jgi:hypothetical protein
MKKIFGSLVLGMLSPFVFILGAEPFEVHGRNSILEILAGSVALALYLAACQFLVTRKVNGGLGARLPAAIAMAVPLFGSLVLMMAVEKRATVISQGLPMLAAGCLGILTGAALASRRTRKTNG